MVDIKKDFEKSFSLLSHHKRIIIPTLLSILVPMVLIFMFLNFTEPGLVLSEVLSATFQFDRMKTSYFADPRNFDDPSYLDQLGAYAESDGPNSTYSQEFDSFLSGKGIFDDESMSKVFNVSTITLVIALLAVGIIAHFFFSCMSYAIIALTMKNKVVDVGSLMSTTMRFFWNLLSIKIIFGFLIIMPLLLAIGTAALSFFVHIAAGILSVIIIIIAFFAYIFFLGLRLFFAAPAVVMDDEGPIRSLKHSFALTKGHINQVLMIVLILVGMSTLANSFIGRPLGDSFIEFLTWPGFGRALISLIVVSLFAIIEAFVFTFENIFLFYSYVDFKELDALTGSQKLPQGG